MMIHILCIAVLLILLGWLRQDIILEKKLKKYSTYCVVLTLIVVLAEAGCSLTDNTVPGNRLWSILFNVIGFGISPFVFLVESNIYHLRQGKKDFWIYVPAVVFLCFVCVSPFTGWIFYVNKACEYSRGPLFAMYLLVFAFSILVTMVRKINAIRNYPRYFRTRITSSTGLMLLGLVVQIIYPMYSVSWMIISVYLVLYYALCCEASGMIDGLTGLLNRAAFNKMILNFKRHKNKQYYLILLDVNDFKQINDTKGHRYGDFCLKEIAAILTDVFVKNAYVFRFGGDEFSILFMARKGTNVEVYISEMKRRVLEKQKLYHPFPGIAVGYEKMKSGKKLREVIDQADQMMYRDKREMKKRRKRQIHM